MSGAESLPAYERRRYVARTVARATEILDAIRADVRSDPTDVEEITTEIAEAARDDRGA